MLVHSSGIAHTVAASAESGAVASVFVTLQRVNRMAFGIQFIFMDSGQGDCTVITLPDGSIIIIDCGANKNKSVVSGVMPTIFDDLLKKGYLRGLILSHPDGDHYNLVDSLLLNRKLVIEHFYYGCRQKDYRRLESKGALIKNDHGDLGKGFFNSSPNKYLSVPTVGKTLGADVRLVCANAGDLDDDKKRNLNSLVVFVTYGGLNFLLMADSTTGTEDFIRWSDAKAGNPLAKLLAGGDTILKVGHHGSGTSTGDDWVKFTKPTAAFISSDTQVFNGTSTSTSPVINRLLNLQDGTGKYVLADGGVKNTHTYVHYNTSNERHEDVTTTRWLYTTINKLIWNKGKTEFQADGVPHYYTVETDGTQWVGIGEGKSQVSKNYKGK
jgi:beta-lactamase superfamily II metal-dependent hydrolase